jgi:poly-beta-1,6-N-acetyl-D-glucosamine synthase
MAYFKALTLLINNLFLYYIILYGIGLFFYAISYSLVIKRKKRQLKYKNFIEREYYVPISLIVVVYNNVKEISYAINSLLELDYKNYEIIIVNDGSTDQTLNKIMEKFGLHKINKVVRKSIDTKPVYGYYESSGRVKITMVNKAHGGLADSLNAGINTAKNPYYLTVSINAILSKDTLKNIAVSVLENNNFIAVGGIVKMANGIIFKHGMPVKYDLPKTFLENVQALEFDRNFMADQMLFDNLNNNINISYCLALYKKSTVITCGGYQTNLANADIDLIIRLHKYCLEKNIPYVIKSNTNAICWIKSPREFKKINNEYQKRHQSIINNLITYRKMLFNPHYKLLAFLTFPHYWFYEIIAPLIEFVGVLSIFIAYFLNILSLKLLLEYLVIYILLGFIFTITAFFSEANINDYKMKIGNIIMILLYALLENLGFRQFLSHYRFKKIR